MFHELFESKNELSGLTYVMHMDRQSINVGLHNLSLIFSHTQKILPKFLFSSTMYLQLFSILRLPECLMCISLLFCITTVILLDA